MQELELLQESERVLEPGQALELMLGLGLVLEQELELELEQVL